MKINYYSLRREGAERDLAVVREKQYEVAGKLTSSKEVVRVMEEIFGLRDLAEERVYMLAIASKTLAGIFEISRGGFDFAMVNPREIFTKALLVGSTNLILLHNHPSGDVEPSAQDIQLCERMNKAGELLGLEMLDFIITGDGYYSAQENGLL